MPLGTEIKLDYEDVTKGWDSWLMVSPLSLGRLMTQSPAWSTLASPLKSWWKCFLKSGSQNQKLEKRELNLHYAFDFLFIFVPLAHMVFYTFFFSCLCYLWGLDTSNEPTISLGLTSLQLVTELICRNFFRLLLCHDLRKQRPCRY